ncbi:MAG: hypothetical protein E7052_08080 [Lentisphaerae bacterium]|nr:hypothetical protein [Lentisphaerota bacterium]
MKRKTLVALGLIAAATSGFAAGVLPYPGTWQRSTCNAQSAVVEGNKVTGLVVGKNPTHPTYAAVQNLQTPLAGDFIGEFTLKYDLLSNNFVGNALVALKNAQNEYIAIAGLRDHWNTSGRMYGSTNFKDNPANVVMLPLSGTLDFRIERVGDQISVFGRGAYVMQKKGSTDPVAKIEIFFDHYPASGKCGQFEFTKLDLRKHDGQAMKITPKTFDEKVSGDFAPEWIKAVQSNHAGLDMVKTDDGLLIKGFKKPDYSKKQAVTTILERPLGAIKGDFTAIMDLDWDVPPDTFMGEVLLQVYSISGKLIAETGLLDGWIAGSPRAAAWVGSPRNGGMVWLPNQAFGPFIITRKGDNCTIHHGHWKLADNPAVMEPAATVKLIIKHSPAFDKANTLLSSFGNIKFRRLAVADKALPIPAPKFAPVKKPAKYEIGRPIITYWAGPVMSEKMARELSVGGWNLAWGVTYHDLDIMHPHNIRGIMWFTLKANTPENQRRVKWWIDSMRHHPAFYAIHCGDEPGGAKMIACQKDVDFLESYAPEILHFNNMFPIAASNKQLGHEGTAVVAYEKHIAEYFERLKPQLLSYDAYNLWKHGDSGSYFVNQAMIRKAGLKYGVKTMNIVQGCSYAPVLRVPTGNEYRYLAYTSLAYGSQGLANYVYGYKGHWGSVHDPETGKTTQLYEDCKSINREFEAIATEVQPLTTLAAWHAGEIPFGTDALPENSAFTLEPKLKNISQGLTDAKTNYAQERNFFNIRPPVTGYLMGVFGKDNQASHILVVNLDYKKNQVVTFNAPGELERFDQFKRTWSDVNGKSVKLDIAPGSGVLLRLKNNASCSLLANNAAEAVVKVEEKVIGEVKESADKFVDTFKNLKAWSQDYRKDCEGLNYQYAEGKGLLVEGLKNAASPAASAYLDRGIPSFVEGDFVCSMEVGVPLKSKVGKNNITITLQIPNGEGLIHIRLKDGKIFSGAPAWNGKQLLSKPLDMTHPLFARGELKIVRQKDVYTLSFGNQVFYKGTGDTSPAGNIRIEFNGQNCQLELRSIVIEKLK